MKIVEAASPDSGPMTSRFVVTPSHAGFDVCSLHANHAVAEQGSRSLRRGTAH